MINVFSKDGEQPTTIAGDLEFENVTFAYSTRKEVSVSILARTMKFISHIYLIYYV